MRIEDLKERQYPGGKTAGSGKDFRAKPDGPKSGKIPGPQLVGSGKPMKVQKGFVGEGQFREPIVMFHGTSLSFLRAILKQGIVPNPRKKVWDTDNNAAHQQHSRASMEGSYWTTNLMTAMSSASNAARKFDGWPVEKIIIVFASISEQSAFADEDSIIYRLKGVWGRIMAELGLQPDAWSHAAYSYYEGPSGWRDQERAATKQKILNDFATYLHTDLGGSDKQPIDHKLAQQVFEAYLVRQLVFHEKGSWGRGPLDDVSEKYRPVLPDRQQAEANLFAVIDKLTRRYRASAYRNNSINGFSNFNHTLRMTQPVTFRGSNKIVGIVEIQYKDYDMPNVLWFGSINDDYLKQYRERIGGYPGLMDGRTKKWIIQPDPSKAAKQAAKPTT